MWLLTQGWNQDRSRSQAKIYIGFETKKKKTIQFNENINPILRFTKTIHKHNTSMFGAKKAISCRLSSSLSVFLSFFLSFFLSNIGIGSKSSEKFSSLSLSFLFSLPVMIQISAIKHVSVLDVSV